MKSSCALFRYLSAVKFSFKIVMAVMQLMLLCSCVILLFFFMILGTRDAPDALSGVMFTD